MRSKTPKEPKYKPVNIAIADWKEYDELAKQLSAATGFPVYIPSVLRKAVAVFKQSLEE